MENAKESFGRLFTRRMEAAAKVIRSQCMDDKLNVKSETQVGLEGGVMAEKKKKSKKKTFKEFKGMMLGTLTVKELMAVLRTVDPALPLAVQGDSDGNYYRTVQYSCVCSMIPHEDSRQADIAVADDDEPNSKKYFVLGV